MRVLGPALLCLALAASGHAASTVVRLTSGDVPISPETTSQFLDELKARPAGTLHGLVALPSHPTAAERGALESAGLHVLSPVHSTIYRVRVEAKWLESSTRAYSLPAVSLTRLDKEHRVHPKLGPPVAAGSTATPVDCLKPASDSTTEAAAPGTAAAAPQTVEVAVRIHGGITEQQLAGVLKNCEKQSDETWLATLTRESLWELAKDDRVQWIDPGPSFKGENDATRKAIRADSVQKWWNGRVHGLGGRNVQVGVFDRGIDEANKDLKGRVIRDPKMPREEAASHHGTFMAGIIAGDGTMSDKLESVSNWTEKNKGMPYQWRGMAPLAELLDIYRRRPNGPNGANAAVHLNFIRKFGMDISNHSYTINDDGGYDNGNQARDQLIRGDATSEGEPVPARLHVTSAGNKEAYFGLTKEMKNALLVGNWHVKNRRLSEKTSAGPAQDGRIKPDVVAPGTNVKSTGYCRPTPTDEDANKELACRHHGPKMGPYGERHDFYTSLLSGSSQAAAVTTGTLALVLEQYNRTYKVGLDWSPPLPSTLRGVMIHTARDSRSPTPWPDLGKIPLWPKKGPDFATGWGLIDAHAAVRTVAERHLLEDVITGTCKWIEYSFAVRRTGRGRVRVTLAWDDVAADSALAGDVPKLVNDLDLVLKDPWGRLHYPWQLDQRIKNPPAHCGTTVEIERKFVAPGKDAPTPTPPSARRGPDHLNNVEVVDAPWIAGWWKVRVLAFNIPQGPQRFSLVGADFRRDDAVAAARR